MINLIITVVTYYGGLIALGFLTHWYIPVVLFIILFGYASHLDYIFLRKRDLRRELNIIALEDLMQVEAIIRGLDSEMEANLKAEDNQSLH